MYRRQLYAFQHPQLAGNPFSSTREHFSIDEIEEMQVESGLYLKGTVDGERPQWWVSIYVRQPTGNMYKLRDLSETQRKALREHATYLLKGVGIDPPTLVGGERTYELIKDCSDDEIAELPEEAKTVRPFIVKVGC
jgi:hypothetical protein